MTVNCCLMVVLYLGGWTLSIGGWGITTRALQDLGLLGGLIGAAIFITKVMFFMLVYIWFRATFPRFRFDQLMDLGWKWMIPLALGNIVVTGVIVLALGKVNGTYVGEIVLSIAGAIAIAFTLFLLGRGARPAQHAKVMHASRVSEA